MLIPNRTALVKDWRPIDGPEHVALRDSLEKAEALARLWLEAVCDFPGSTVRRLASEDVSIDAFVGGLDGQEPLASISMGKSEELYLVVSSDSAQRAWVELVADRTIGGSSMFELRLELKPQGEGSVVAAIVAATRNLRTCRSLALSDSRVPSPTEWDRTVHLLRWASLDESVPRHTVSQCREAELLARRIAAIWPATSIADSVDRSVRRGDLDITLDLRRTNVMQETCIELLLGGVCHVGLRWREGATSVDLHLREEIASRIGVQGKLRLECPSVDAAAERLEAWIRRK